MINFSNISSADKLLYSIIFLAVMGLVSVAIIFYLKSWKQRLKYTKIEIGRARNDREKRHWERELKMVYWSLIPGITVRRLKKIRKFFLKQKEKK